MLAAFYELHLLGVLGSPVLLVLVPYLWFVEHWLSHRAGAERVPLSSLLARTTYLTRALALTLILTLTCK